MCTFRDSAADLNKVSAQVLGVSYRHILRAESLGRSAEAELPAAQ
jgi:peroxiredoxin